MKREHQEIECKYCGDGPFWWQQTGRRWELVDEFGEVHDCQNKSADEDDFEDLTE